MGLGPGYRTNNSDYAIRTLPNPDPSKFKIIRLEQIKNNLVVMLNYTGCTNYEGNKILIFKNFTTEEFLKFKIIDPHFSEHFKPLIARFSPTEEGWQHAVFFASLI